MYNVNPLCGATLLLLVMAPRTYIEVLPCCLLQVVYYRTGEPLFLSADGSVDAQHGPILYSQASSTG